MICMFAFDKGFPLLSAIPGVVSLVELAELFTRTELILFPGQSFHYPSTARWVMAGLTTRRLKV